MAVFANTVRVFGEPFAQLHPVTGSETLLVTVLLYRLVQGQSCVLKITNFTLKV